MERDDDISNPSTTPSFMDMRRSTTEPTSRDGRRRRRSGGCVHRRLRQPGPRLPTTGSTAGSAGRSDSPACRRRHCPCSTASPCPTDTSSTFSCVMATRSSARSRRTTPTHRTRHPTRSSSSALTATAWCCSRSRTTGASCASTTSTPTTACSMSAARRRGRRRRSARRRPPTVFRSSPSRSRATRGWSCHRGTTAGSRHSPLRRSPVRRQVMR